MRNLALAMMVSAMGIAAGLARATTFTVNPGDSIQAVINNDASDGDTIEVKAGTYDELLTIDKAITLTGEDKTTTILTYSGSSVEQQIMLGANTGLNLTGGCVIENFTIANGGMLTGDNDLIKFRAHGDGGQIIIRDNIFDGNGLGDGFGAAKAIEEAYESDNFVITGNAFDDCAYGIWANGLQDGEITGNTFSRSTSGAIGMGGSGSGDAAPHDILVAGNTMDGAKYGLVLAENLHDVTFSCNTISNNTFGGVVHWEFGPADWSNMEFENNNIVGNAAGMRGFSDPGAAVPSTLDATMNWWGDASGPSGVGPGTGDSLQSTDVLFDPWLTAPASCQATVIPEPLTMLGVLAAVAGLGGYLRRRLPV